MTHQPIYDLFIDYFDTPVFTKLKNVEDYSIYMCKLNVHLANLTRYLVCIVPKDVFFSGDTQSLKDLKWKVFQTRELSESHTEIRHKHFYKPKQGNVFQTPIEKIGMDGNNTKYRTSENFLRNCEITLLFNPKSLFDYPKNGTFNSALETYYTMVELI